MSGPGAQFEKLDDEVDLDADTKETTEEICDAETEESPHKIILYYGSDTSDLLVKYFPKKEILKQIGTDVCIGRYKSSDVLLVEPQMARIFAAVTCRTDANKKTIFVLKNVCDSTKQKRIQVTDAKGSVSELLPTQETELTEKTAFRLVSLTFYVAIELGDVNARTFVLEVKSQEDKRQKREITDDVLSNTGAAGSAHVGLSVQNSLESKAAFSDQVIPKRFVSLGTSPTHVYGQGYVQGSPDSAYRSEFDGISNCMPQVAPQHYLTGVQYTYHPVHPYPAYCQPQVGYCEVQTPRYSFQPQPQPQFRHPPPNVNLHPLLERSGGNNPDSLGHSSDQQRPRNISMSELVQALAEAQGSSPPNQIPTQQSIVAQPMSPDRNPVLYPSPAQPRFRFPQPEIPLSPTRLSDLPRGPPLGSLSSHVSVDLNPTRSSRAMNAVTESGTTEWKPTKREPIEHKDM